jgi:CRISPR-associated protein Cas1
MEYGGFLEMVTLYVSHDDGILGRRGDALFYKKGRSGDGETVPIHIVDNIVILGKGSVSTPALHFIMENDIPLHFIDSAGRYKGSLTSGRGRGYSIRRLQLNAAFSEESVLRIARSIVAGKIANQLKTLLRVKSRHAEDPILSRACTDLKNFPSLVANCRNIESVRGHEGLSAAIYFSVFGRLLREPWIFQNRNRRPPRDPVNAMLSFGYTLLLSHVASAVVTSGLDPCVGFLHPEYRGRPSLALDLMEEFRSQVVDRLVLALVNQGVMKPENFSKIEDGGVYMETEARKLFMKYYAERLDVRVTDKRSGNTTTFRNHIFASAAAFAASLKTGSDYIPFKFFDHG